MRTFLILVSLTFISSLTFAQKQNNNWYFGFNAGLSFTSSTPTALQSDMIGYEGTASVSDPEGNLLFYTNGLVVWDRNHNIMPNGEDLNGGVSSTQAALIVPLPNSNTKYYLFTTEDQDTDGGLNYSIVDLTLNGGFGDIVSSTKNTLVVDQTAEKITAILHPNGFNIWIITHRLNSNEFLAFLLTSVGLDTVPVISAIGSFYPSEAHIGPIKSSHSGSKLISSATYHDITEIFDFDPITGIISNAYDINNLFEEQQFVYGFEFSPNDSLLYLSTAVQGNFLNSLVQINLYSSELTVLNTNTEYNYGALQLGPDMKIYMARNGFDFLDVIHQPDKSGNSCQYAELGVMLAPGTVSALGLPNYVPYSFLLDTNNFPSLGRDTVLCKGTSLVLSINFPTNCDSTIFLWSDESSGPELSVNQSGTYWVHVESPCMSFTDTIQIDFISCLPIVYYDLEDCESYMINGTNMDYTEFVAAYPNSLTCADVVANYLFRSPPQENKHSCTPGVNGTLAMCVSTYPSCTYSDGDQTSVVMEFTLNPYHDSIVRITGFEFYEKSPSTYSWIDGGSGPNNYPRRYGIRILKNGDEIFRITDVLTTTNWTLQSYSFLENDLFRVEESTSFRIELLPYCPVGNGAMVSAWDIDELKIFGYCVAVQKSDPIIHGVVITEDGHGISNVEIILSENPDFVNTNSTLTNTSGSYLFDPLQSGHSYFLKGYNNDDIMNGVSTLDLIQIQKHLLGIMPFTSLPQYIAADANHNGNVSAMDMMEIRKLILGIYEEFPKNTSWRFGMLPQDMNEPDISSFVETASIEYLDKDILQNFVGIKIGDVNGDVQLDSYSSKIEKRSGSQLNLLINDIDVKSEIPFSIDIRLEKKSSVYGIQFALELKNMEFISLTNSGLPITVENYSIIDGILRFSWNSNEVLNIPDNGVLFSLVLKSSFDGFLSDKITLLDHILKAQVYYEKLEPNVLSLNFTSSNLNDNKYNFLKIDPNPVISQINIHFYFYHGGKTDIRFFNLEGKLLYGFNKTYFDGEHLEIIEVDKLSTLAGVIYCQIITDDSFMIEKLLIAD